MCNPIKNFMSRLATDIKSSVAHELFLSDLPLIPKLRLQIIQQSKTHSFTLDHNDIYTLFSFYGEVLSISLNSSQEAMVLYKEIVPAYMAQKTLNGKYYEDIGISLKVNWISAFPDTKKSFPMRVKCGTCENTDKFTCKFLINIEDSADFQTARKIIGPNGRNMKNIIEACNLDCNEDTQNIVKLRLRGKGSGFKEGPFNEEINEPLHLCVSSKFYAKFQMACREVEKLIRLVHTQYVLHMKKKGVLCGDFEIKMMQ